MSQADNDVYVPVCGMYFLFGRYLLCLAPVLGMVEVVSLFLEAWTFAGMAGFYRPVSF